MVKEKKTAKAAAKINPAIWRPHRHRRIIEAKADGG